ncbi:MAG: type II CRISPR RNA-guided endonuclease Cas9 [Muribaculaceae bacterium]|nr:type II CRISPR RNA-guided endonuclease Cas9 [Muribaculaceae bacterium]
MKKILGLDVGTNSIGWAVVNAEQIYADGSSLKPISIEAANSRIIPMDAAVMGDFDKGVSVSQTAERTDYRGKRRLLERSLLRRERMHRVLEILGFLPQHYLKSLTRYGKIKKGEEPKLAWYCNQEGVHEFLFMNSFNEMLHDFILAHPEFAGKKIPYDWTIYYLRKKALTHQISKFELAWLLLNFNQKRGYYQLRGEDDIDEKKEVKYYALKVLKVEPTEDKKGDSIWYNVFLENGMIYRRPSNIYLDWEGKIKEFIVTTDLNDDGSYKVDKEGNVKRSFRSPMEEDWALLKAKTEADLISSGKTVGSYIYDSILQNPQQRIIGKLIRTIERKFYKEELRLILNKQKEFIPELNDRELYKKCVEELYFSNEAHRYNIENRDFSYLFVDDILFYQRPLKSKKSLISNCPYESYKYVKVGKDGNKKIETQGIKCIAVSHPLYQEFRLWQFVSNLKIYQREKLVGDKLCKDVDVTTEFIKSEEDLVNLFDWLNNRSSVKQDSLFASYFELKKKKSENYPYRWNYVEDKEYPCNETRSLILKKLNAIGVESSFLTQDRELQIWHLLYSIDGKDELQKALKKYLKVNNELSETFVKEFSTIKPFEKRYGAYSAKAIKKLLSLMRFGKYWDIKAIDANTKERIHKLINGEYDDNISNRVREKVEHLDEISQFRGLPLWLACYIVYNRHSEANDIVKWNSPKDIDDYLCSFKQHSLRNPIVEQVVTETLRTVRDIWEKVGHIDEIHIELGRSMKNPADKRKVINNRILEHENANIRIKNILVELKSDGIDNVRPHSPSHHEILKIYEEYALGNLTKEDKDFEIIKKISKTAYPTKAEIIRYKACLKQKYISPYTGEIIPLSKLFTPAYEIEHIIPQSRYFDDSLSNKVICESEVNKLKDRMLGCEFIKKHHGEKVQLSSGKVVEIFSEEKYREHVRTNFLGNKREKLLLEDIPDKFIERQLNDTRYISKFVKSLLSNIVREEVGDGKYEEEVISKNVIVCSGGVTDRLKKDWGMNDVWNAIILPRFQRLNMITGTLDFTTFNREGHEIPDMPLTLQKGFNKKRIDHRHHALDAIVIACASRNHINLLNNESAHSNHNANRYQLSRLLRRKESVIVDGCERVVFKEFYKPWETFTVDVKNLLGNMVVSFKQNIRVINKATNRYTKYVDGEKKIIKQKGKNWAIRKSMHKETVFGEVNLQMVKTVSLKDAVNNISRIVDKELKRKLSSLIKEGNDLKKIKKYFEENKDTWQDINLSKIGIYYYTKETKDRYFATRKPLDSSYDSKKIKEHITDSGIQKILLRHLAEKGNDPNIAFSPDGIDELNANIIRLNDGKFHQPIRKIRYYEKGSKFAVGKTGNKGSKFVEAADGTNLYFAIYETEQIDKSSGEITKKRTFASIPLNLVVERLKLGLPPAPSDENGVDPTFVLSPNDLVYLPNAIENKNAGIDYNRIYKFVSCNKNQAFFILANIASPILGVTKIYDQNELGSNNKAERAWTGEMIKETCVPIKIDRLGSIIKIGY